MSNELLSAAEPARGFTRPAFGTQPIRCTKRACKWKGYETEMKKVPHPTISIATQNVCPSCGCDSYYFMTPREIAAWERARAAEIGRTQEAAHG